MEVLVDYISVYKLNVGDINLTNTHITEISAVNYIV